MGWYKVEFLRDYLRLFWIHPIFLLEFIFLGGMILNMKKFFIQWSYIKKDMNFKILWNFLDFILIFQAFLHINSFKRGQKFKKSWDHGPHKSCNLSRWIILQWIGRSTIFVMKFPIKRCSSFVNSSFDWIVKILSDFRANPLLLRDLPAF